MTGNVDDASLLYLEYKKYGLIGLLESFHKIALVYAMMLVLVTLALIVVGSYEGAFIVFFFGFTGLFAAFWWKYGLPENWRERWYTDD